MIEPILRLLFRALGASAMAIGGSNFLFGIASTASLIDMALQIMGMAPSDLGEFATASVDSEFRFYSVFWFTYGVVLWRTAGKLNSQLKLAGWLIALFALGGVGRILSYLSLGSPAPLFVLLGWIEIVVSIAMGALWLMLVNRSKVQSAA